MTNPDEPTGDDVFVNDEDKAIDLISDGWQRFLQQLGHSAGEAKNQMRIFLESNKETLSAAIASGDTMTLESVNARLKGQVARNALSTISGHKDLVVPFIDAALNFVIKLLV